MAGYLTNNPYIIVKGFIQSGISRALNGVNIDEEENIQKYHQIKKHQMRKHQKPLWKVKLFQ